MAEIRRFVKIENYGSYEESEWIFIKDESTLIEIHSYSCDLWNTSELRINSEKVSSKWNDAMITRDKYYCSDVLPERKLILGEEDNFNEDEAEENFDAAVEAARDWLYA